MPVSCSAPMVPIYRFGDSLIDESAIRINEHELSLPGYAHPVDLDLPNRYGDMV